MTSLPVLFALQAPPVIAATGERASDRCTADQFPVVATTVSFSRVPLLAHPFRSPTLIIAERSDDEKDSSSARLDTEEGRVLQFACEPGARAMTASSVDRFALYPVMKKSWRAFLAASLLGHRNMAVGFGLRPALLMLDPREIRPPLSIALSRRYSRRRRPYEVGLSDLADGSFGAGTISKHSSIRKLMIRDEAGQIQPIPQRSEVWLEGQPLHSEPQFLRPVRRSEIPSCLRRIAHERCKPVFRSGAVQLASRR